MDAERSRSALLGAALDEFSAKGFAGARVRDIATRAGVSKDLINYYFGSKAGLYQAVLQEWVRGLALSEDGEDLPSVMVGHLRAVLADPRTMRLLAWHGLGGQDWTGEGTTPPAMPTLPDVPARLARRQADGGLAVGLDPAALSLVLAGVLAVPVVMPMLAELAYGVAVDDPTFVDRYSAGLEDILRRLSSDAGRTSVHAS